MADDFDKLDDFDDNLDSMFDDDKSGSNSPSRGVLGKSTSAFLDEFDGSAPADDMKTLVSGALPSLVGNDTADKLTEATVSFKDQLEESSRLIKTKSKPLLRRLKKAVPEDGFLSSVVNKLNDLAGEDNDSGRTVSREELQLREINNSILASLGNSDTEAKKEMIKSHMQHSMAASTDEKLSKMLAYAIENSNFNTKVTRSYYVKSLELQYRHLYMARDTKDVLRLGFDSLTKLTNVVVKNTGLPDYLKLRNLEAVSSKFRNSLIENFQSSVTADGSMFDRTAKAFKKNMSNLTNNVGDMLSQGNEFGEMVGLGEEKDPDFSMSGEQMAGMTAADTLKRWVGKTIGTEIRSSKYGKKLDDELSNFSLDSSAYFGDKASDSKSKIGKSVFGFLSKALKTNDGGLTDNKVLTDGNDNPAIFTNRVSTSITKVIPGYLSKILKEVSSIRSGKTEDELVYNFSRDNFSTSNEINKDFKELLKRDSKHSGIDRNIIQVVKNLSTKTGITLSKEETREISKALYDFSRLGYSMSPQSLINHGFYQTIENPSLGIKLKMMINAYGKGKDGNVDTDAQEKLYKGFESIKKVSRNDDTARINAMIDNGHSDQLRSMGILKYSKKTGGNTIDSQRVSELRSAGVLDSIDDEYDNYQAYNSDLGDGRNIEDGYIKRFGRKILGLSINDVKSISAESVSKFKDRVDNAYKKSPLVKIEAAEKIFRTELGKYLRIDYRPKHIGGKAMFYARVADIARSSDGKAKIDKFFDEKMPKSMKKHSKIFKAMIFNKMTKILESDNMSSAKTVLNGSKSSVDKFLKEHGDTTVGEGLENVKESTKNGLNAVKDYYNKSTVKSVGDDIDKKTNVKSHYKDGKLITNNTLDFFSETTMDYDGVKSRKFTKDSLKKGAEETFNKAKDKVTRENVLFSIDETLKGLFKSDEKQVEAAEEEKKEAKKKEKKDEQESKKKAKYEKNKKNLDRDGDGDRDGGWLDIFSNKKDGSVDQKKLDKEMKKGKKKGGIFGLLGGLLKLPFTMIGGLASIIKGTLGGFLGLGGLLRGAGLALTATSTILGGGLKLIMGTIKRLPALLTGLGAISKTLFNALGTLGGSIVNKARGGKNNKGPKGRRPRGKFGAMLGLATMVGSTVAADSMTENFFNGDKDPFSTDVIDEYLGESTKKVTKVDDITDDVSSSSPVSGLDIAVASAAVPVAQAGIEKAGSAAKKFATKLNKGIPSTAKEAADKKDVLKSFRKSKHAKVVTEANSAIKVVENGKAVVHVGKFSKGVFTTLKVLKKVPLLGIIVGGGFAARRIMDGDFAGGMMELSAGVSASIPFVGLPLSIAIDYAIYQRDVNGTTGILDENGVVMRSWKWLKNAGVTTSIPIVNAASAAYDILTGRGDESVMDKKYSNSTSPAPASGKKLNSDRFGPSVADQVDTNKYVKDKGYKGNKKSGLEMAKDAANNEPDSTLGVSSAPTSGQSTLKGVMASIGFIIRSVESDNKYNIAKNIGDSGGISFGAYQLTETSGSLKRFMVEYVKLKPLNLSKAKNFNQLMGKNKFRGNRTTFKSWLKKIGSTDKGIKAQDKVFEEMYYKPGMSMASKFKSIDVKLHIIDSYHNGGPNNAKYVASHIKAEDMDSVERARIDYWKTLSNWKKFGGGWMGRLEKMRALAKKYLHDGTEIPMATSDLSKEADPENDTKAESGGGFKKLIKESINTLLEFFGADPIDFKNTGSSSSGSTVSTSSSSGGVSGSVKPVVSSGPGISSKSISVSSTVDENTAKIRSGGSKFGRLGKRVENIGEIPPSKMNGGNINNITVHCTATPTGQPCGAVKIDGWHKGKGWAGCGYHFVINVDGSIEYGRNVDHVGAHVGGHNTGNIGISYAGGVKADGKTDDLDAANPAQVKSIVNLAHYLAKINGVPKENIVGHRDFPNVNKSCPNLTMANIRNASFSDIDREAKDANIKEKASGDPEITTKVDKNEVPLTETEKQAKSVKKIMDARDKGVKLAKGAALAVGASTVLAASPVGTTIDKMNRSYVIDRNGKLSGVSIDDTLSKNEDNTSTEAMKNTMSKAKTTPVSNVVSGISDPLSTILPETLTVMRSMDNRLAEQVALQQKTVDILSNMSGLGNSAATTKIDDTKKKKVTYKGSKEPIVNMKRKNGKVT